MSDERHYDPLQDDPRDIYGKIDALLGRRVGFAPPSEVEEFDDFPLLTDVVVQDGADDPAAYARSGEGSSGIAFAPPDRDAAGFADAEYTPASLPDLGVTLPHYDLGGPAGSEDGFPQVPIEMPGHDAAEFADAAFNPANVPDPSIISPHENLADPAVCEQGSLQAPIEMPDLDTAESPEPEFTPTNLPDLGIIPPNYDLDLIEPLPLGPLEEGLSELIARQQAQLEAMIRRVVREELERHQRSLE